ncbi:MAG: aldolase catalytic domain-containing protein [Dehalococcoidales bacterium]|nr:aldolase catalytic domain-containing protein [Dehalococcoidales bacterium]
MRDIKILDCTLRDGGFVNDWNFGKGSMKSIIGRLDKAGVDIVEIGFLDSRRTYDPNRSIQPDTESLKTILENTDIKNAIIVAMIDFGTCGIELVEHQTTSCINGIRVIFKKKDCREALKFCSQLKEKGYKLFLQPVSVTGYSDDEMTDLLDEVNKLEPYGISIVDTYGLMHKKQLIHYFNLMDGKLEETISIGYHSHNNFQLSYANCVELIEMNSERSLILDASLYGMGKSAGNANTELIAMYLNRNFGSRYDVNQLLEAIDVDIMKEYAKKFWGYSLMHYIAASNDCHPDFVKTLIDKRTLSVWSINEILGKLEQKSRLTFNKELIEKMYEEYQNVVVDDAGEYIKLAKELGGGPILIIAPGNSIVKHKEEIDKYINERKPLVISTNFVTDKYKTDYVFFGNAKRYSQFYDEIYKDGASAKVICTSNVSESNKFIDFTFNFNSLISREEPIRDNPMLMLLKILVKINVKSAALAGFDGYSYRNADNYFEEYIKFLYCSDDVILRNNIIKNKVKDLKNEIELRFVTPSAYV